MNPFEEFALLSQQERRAVMASTVRSGVSHDTGDGQVTPSDALRRLAMETRPGRKLVRLKTLEAVDELMNSPAAQRWMQEHLDAKTRMMLHVIADERRNELTRGKREAFIADVGRRFLDAQTEAELEAALECIGDRLIESSLADRERIVDLYEKSLRRVKELAESSAGSPALAGTEREKQ